jgi:hypothetical protein
MQDAKHFAFLMHPTHVTSATEGSRKAHGHAGGCIKKAPAEAGASRIAAELEGMGSHGSGRSGGLGFAGGSPRKGGAQPSAGDSGKRLKGCGVLSGDEALTLPVIHGLLGDAQ